MPAVQQATLIFTVRLLLELQAGQHRCPLLLHGIETTCLVSTKLVTVLAVNFGFDTSSMTLVSSCAKPPCSACFAELPV